MKVLVTGASGFLGGAACAELLARGHDVSALVRRPGSEPAGTRPIAGDVTDGPALGAALAAERPEAVLHLAAEIASQRSVERIERVNVEGTRHLLTASEAAGVRRLVFTSTIITGDAHGALLTEQSQLPVETPYGRSKREGERLVRAARLETVIVRPGHIYGPGGWYASEFVRRVREPGRFAVIGSGSNLWPMVRVEDVASACVDALERAPDGALYHVVDDEPISFADFIGLTASALGRGAPRSVPASVARLIGGRHAVTAVTASIRSSNERIKRELGWTPRWPSSREGVPDAIARLAS